MKNKYIVQNLTDHLDDEKVSNTLEDAIFDAKECFIEGEGVHVVLKIVAIVGRESHDKVPVQIFETPEKESK